MHARRIRPAAVALAVSLLLCAAPRAGAEEGRRVLVAQFEGPSPTAPIIREAVVKVVSDFYEVLPLSKYRVARRRLNITQDSMKTSAQVARKIGADAIIEGKLTGRQLTVSVREGKTGRVVDRFAIKVQDRGLSDSSREALTDELVDLIDWTEPLKGEADGTAAGEPFTAVADGQPGGAPRATLAAAKTAPPSAEKWSVADARARTKRKPKPRPPAIQVRAAVGIAATARNLSFAHQTDLPEERRPPNMSGSPSAGVAIAGTFDVNPIGLSADLIYQRSIGASVSFPSGGMNKQLSITLSHLGGRLMMRRALSRRVAVRGGAGYHQIAFSISSKPTGLLIPDSRYAYADAGGGVRLSLRDDRLAVSGDVWYLHVLSAGGITGPNAFGSSRFQGFGAELGFEIDAGDSTYVRLAGTFQRLILAFNGDGALSTGLDESSDIDVSGASDTYIGAVAMLGFRL